MARTGLSEEEARKAGRRVKSILADANDRPGICPNPNRIHIKLIYEDNTHKILGAQAWGGKNVALRVNAIAVAVSNQMTVEELGNVEFIYSSPECAFWDPVNIACNSVGQR